MSTLYHNVKSLFRNGKDYDEIADILHANREDVVKVVFATRNVPLKLANEWDKTCKAIRERAV